MLEWKCTNTVCYLSASFNILALHTYDTLINDSRDAWLMHKRTRHIQNTVCIFICIWEISGGFNQLNLCTQTDIYWLTFANMEIFKELMQPFHWMLWIVYLAIWLSLSSFAALSRKISNIQCLLSIIVHFLLIRMGVFVAQSRA